MLSNPRMIKNDLLMFFLLCVLCFSKFPDFLSFVTCYDGLEFVFSMNCVYKSLCMHTPKGEIVYISKKAMVCLCVAMISSYACL